MLPPKDGIVPFSEKPKSGLLLGDVGEIVGGGGRRVGFGGMVGRDVRLSGGELLVGPDREVKEETLEETGEGDCCDSAPLRSGPVACSCSVNMVTVFVCPEVILSECLESDVFRGRAEGSVMAAIAALCLDRISCAYATLDRVMVMSDTVVVEVMATSPKKNRNSSIRSSVQAKLVDERAMEHKLFEIGRAHV